MPSQLGAGRPFGRKWKPYVPDDRVPTLRENAKRTEQKLKKRKRG
jgi:hypothetical protein